jgi:hypothetical protein
MDLSGELTTLDKDINKQHILLVQVKSATQLLSDSSVRNF